MSRRGLPITKQMKEERRKRAEKAKEEYDKLSLQEKLDRLPPDGAQKQRARLLKQIEESKNKKINKEVQSG